MGLILELNPKGMTFPHGRFRNSSEISRKRLKIVLATTGCSVGSVWRLLGFKVVIRSAFAPALGPFLQRTERRRGCCP